MFNLIAGAVLIIVFIAVMLPIGLGVSNSLLNAYPRSDWTEEMNSTAMALQQQTATSFNLLTVVPLVVGAGIVIAVLFAVFRRGA